MRKFSVVIQQVLVIFAVLVLPSILLFMSYANSIADSSTRERENAVQSSLQYVNQTFGLLIPKPSESPHRKIILQR